MKHLIPISGKDSAATAIVQKTYHPELPYEYFFNEVGAELPEIDEWLNKVSMYLEAPITRIGADLESIIYEQGILPSHQQRYCTRLAKIYPMEDYIGSDEAVVYFGIRADEQRIGYRPVGKRTHIAPAYPLQEHGVRLPDVWSMLEHNGLLPPAFFWKSVYERVCEILSVDMSLVENLKPWEKTSLFAGRSRANCYFCFYQRRYEYAWLYETHPDLFWRAVEIEEEVGSTGYYWREGLPLRTFAQNVETYREKRVRSILKFLKNKQDDEDNQPDFLAVTSCGLFCGK